MEGRTDYQNLNILPGHMSSSYGDDTNATDVTYKMIKRISMLVKIAPIIPWRTWWQEVLHVKLNCRFCISRVWFITSSLNILESKQFCIEKWQLQFTAEPCGMKSKSSEAKMKVWYHHQRCICWSCAPLLYFRGIWIKILTSMPLWTTPGKGTKQTLKLT